MPQHQYSAEVIAQALARALEAPVAPGSITDAVKATVFPLLDLLGIRAAVFYAACDSPLGTAPPVKITMPGAAQPQVPLTLSKGLEDYVAMCAGQLTTHEDTAFAHEHLRHLPAALAASSSLWTTIGHAHIRMGTLALIDPSRRDFETQEISLIRMFATQLATTLHAAPPAKKEEPKPSPHEILAVTALSSQEVTGVMDSYMEFHKIMSGVSRDLINPLTGMRGYLDLLKTEPLTEQQQRYLMKLEEQTDKLKSIIISLQSAGPYTRPAPPTPQEPYSVAAAASVSQPPASTPASEAVPNVRTMPLPAARNAKILLVQRNDAVLAFQKSVLGTIGAEVVVAQAGWEAINCLKTDNVDAVIIDDELDGDFTSHKLFHWIADNKPELANHVLMTLSASSASADWVEEEHVPHVKKPLQLVNLFSGVQQVLGISDRNSKLLN